MTDKEKAQEAWVKRATGVAKGMRVSNINAARISDYMLALSDYKQSLQKQIEKRLTELEEDESEFSDEEVYFATRECKRIIELLDLTKPD